MKARFIDKRRVLGNGVTIGRVLVFVAGEVVARGIDYTDARCQLNEQLADLGCSECGAEDGHDEDCIEARIESYEKALG